MRSDLEHLRSVFMAVENGDLGMLKSLGIKDSELGDVKFFLEKLVKTGFLDWKGNDYVMDKEVVATMHDPIEILFSSINKTKRKKQTSKL